MSATIFADATIITMAPDRRIIVDGAVAIDGRTIAAVGKSEEICRAFPAASVRHLDGAILMPGLVDGHVHLPQALLRGAADELPLWRWMSDRIFILEAQFTPADAQAAARLAVLEMIKSGTTTFLETLVLGRHDLPSLANTVHDTGVRAILPRAVTDGGGYLGEAPLHPDLVESPQSSIDEALSVAAHWANSDRIRVWFGPRSTGGCGEALLRQLVDVARREGLGLCQHYAMTSRERAWIQQQYGCSPGEFLRRTGMLGPDVVLLHGCALDAGDIATLAETGTSVVHCPTGPAKMGSGVTPVVDLLSAGVNVALGTDGGPANNGGDLVRDFKWVAYLQKLAKGDPTVMTAEQVLEAATIGGAKAVGLGHLIGSIEPGKRADLVLVRNDGPHWTPTLSYVSNLVYSATGADIDTVMIDGELVMEGRRVLTLDESEVLAEGRERAADIYRRSGLTITPAWPVV